MFKLGYRRIRFRQKVLPKKTNIWQAGVFSVLNVSHRVRAQFITARIRRTTGDYIFSLSTLWGGGGSRSSLGRGGYLIQPWMEGYPIQPWMGGVPQPWMGGYPIPCPGGYPNLGRGGIPHLGGVPHPMSGRGTPGTQSHRNSKHLLRLRGGRCASCVHAGGLSCYRCFSYI